MTAQTKHQVKVVKKNKDMNQLSATSNVILNIVFILAVIITVAPIWVIIMASFTSEKALQTYGYGFWPQEWSTYAYTFLFSKGSIIGTAYKNTIIATVVGTILCVISVGLYAYPISRKDFRWRNVFTFISFFTMLFNAGTVPFYVTCRASATPFGRCSCPCPSAHIGLSSCARSTSRTFRIPSSNPPVSTARASGEP